LLDELPQRRRHLVGAGLDRLHNSKRPTRQLIDSLGPSNLVRAMVVPDRPLLRWSQPRRSRFPPFWR
jgi:hypothetical protein